jgi:hypothetical protein
MIIVRQRGTRFRPAPVPGSAWDTIFALREGTGVPQSGDSACIGRCGGEDFRLLAEARMPFTTEPRSMSKPPRW